MEDNKNLKSWKNVRGLEKKYSCIPLHEKGDTEKMENYRWISLLCSAYKIYAEIVKKWLERRVERKGLLPENQVGFRRERSQWIIFIY